MVQSRGGALSLFVDRRILRYTQAHDLTVSAWRLGPLTHLIIVDDVLVLHALQQWEDGVPAPTAPRQRDPPGPAGLA